jgi:hypothetical protein
VQARNVGGVGFNGSTLGPTWFDAPLYWVLMAREPKAGVWHVLLSHEWEGMFLCVSLGLSESEEVRTR